MDQRLGNAVRQVRNWATGSPTEELSDQELLQRFVEVRDEAAFAALVQRHGPMVLGVCRRVVQDADAEDAWQATFLALARKADTVRRREAVSGWLFRVAHHVALKVRSSVARHGACDGTLVERQGDANEEVTWREALAVLDEELGRLPASYRAALVLCYLEGKTQDEAARQLGWSVGTLRGQLERGRDKLRTRLLRRGVGVPSALLSVALGQRETLAAGLVGNLVRAIGAFTAGEVGAVSARVAELAAEGAKVMGMSKLKLGVMVVVVAGVLAAPVGMFLHQAGTASQAEKGKSATVAAPLYFPTTKGTRLVYRLLMNVEVPKGPAGTTARVGVEESEITEVVTAVERTDAGIVVTLTQEEEGKGKTGTDTFLISPKGVFTTGASVIQPFKGSWKFDPPSCLLQMPHKEGNTWKFEGPAQPGGLVEAKMTKTAHGPEEVVVPAGKFRAIRVETRGTSNGREAWATFWYAPEVGLVKMAWDGAVQELKAVKPGANAEGGSKPVDLSKIDRTIRKEPTYTGKPRYALVVLGPEAKTRVWMVMDGETLYVDRNGNGDLTEANERVPLDVEATKKIKLGPGMYKGMNEFNLGKIDGVPLVLNYWVRDVKYVPKNDFEKGIHKDHVEKGWENSTLYPIAKDGSRAQTPLMFCLRPEDAQIAHVAGRPTITLRSHENEPLYREQEENVFQVMIGTPGLPARGSRYPAFSPLTTSEVPADVHPVAKFEFPNKVGGKPPIKLDVVLEKRC